jgi:hypothetical protein
VSRKHWIWIVAAGAALVLGAVALRPFFAYAHIAVGYAAQQTCACMHVSGRDFDSCMSDYPPDARSQIRVRPQGDRVRASAMGGLFNATAVYEKEYGCHLKD